MICAYGIVVNFGDAGYWDDGVDDMELWEYGIGVDDGEYCVDDEYAVDDEYGVDDK